jgi:hypothetical protein
MNLYDFLVDTYEDTLPDDKDEENTTKTKAGLPGRPRKRRIPYLTAHKPKKCRVERTPGHEVLPRFIGKWFPRVNDTNGNNDLHHATILLFFKPWRALQDLKANNETFQHCYALFLETATDKQRTMLENIQYYHECWDVAQKRRDAFRAGKTFKLFDYEQSSMPMMDDDQPQMESEDVIEADEADGDRARNTWHDNITEQSIEMARLQQTEECDRVFAREAMLLARAANVFGDEFRNATTISESPGLLRRATPEDMKVFHCWEGVLKEITRKQQEEEGETNLKQIHLYAKRTINKPSIELESDSRSEAGQSTEEASPPQNSMHTNRPKLAMLNADQRKAHDMIESHLFGTCNNSKFERHHGNRNSLTYKRRTTDDARHRTGRHRQICSCRSHNRDIRLLWTITGACKMRDIRCRRHTY